MKILCHYCEQTFVVERELKPGEYMDECPNCGETVETEIETGMKTCSGCDGPIEPFTKFLCIYKTPGGFRLEVGCGHYTPPEGWDYIFGGSRCFFDWLDKFMVSLTLCNHKDGRGVL